jgi:hypothetical protein
MTDAAAVGGSLPRKRGGTDNLNGSSSNTSNVSTKASTSPVKSKWLTSGVGFGDGSLLVGVWGDMYEEWDPALLEIVSDLLVGAWSWSEAEWSQQVPIFLHSFLFSFFFFSLGELKYPSSYFLLHFFFVGFRFHLQQKHQRGGLMQSRGLLSPMVRLAPIEQTTLILLPRPRRNINIQFIIADFPAYKNFYFYLMWLWYKYSGYICIYTLYSHAYVCGG